MLPTDHTAGHIVRAEDLVFSYGDRNILDGLSLTIARGTVTVVMGPSGCGKSTFLGLLGGRLQAGSGTLWFDGEPVPRASGPDLFRMRRKMGMLFQNSALLTDLSVYDNVAFPIREQTGLPEELVRILVLMKLEMVGLRGAHGMMPSALSGGMMRRVALARAIALDPVMIMYDEPFVGLDPVSMGVILRLIRSLNDALGLTSVVVTHDVSEGCSIADRIYLMDGGRIAGSGTAGEMLGSEDPWIRQFMQGCADGPVRYHHPAGDYLEEIRGG